MPLNKNRLSNSEIYNIRINFYISAEFSNEDFDNSNCSNKYLIRATLSNFFPLIRSSIFWISTSKNCILFW